MKYWKNGFYETQSVNDDRFEITDVKWKELLDKQSAGLEIFTKEDGEPEAREYVVTEYDKLIIQIEKIKIWFNWYDNQIQQAQREERMGTISTWSAEYKINEEIVKTYSSISELDAEAKLAQSTLKELSAKLIEEDMIDESQLTSTQDEKEETSAQEDNMQSTSTQNSQQGNPTLVAWL